MGQALKAAPSWIILWELHVCCVDVCHSCLLAVFGFLNGHQATVNHRICCLNCSAGLKIKLCRWAKTSKDLLVWKAWLLRDAVARLCCCRICCSCDCLLKPSCMVIVDVVEISLWEQRSVMFKIIFISRINVLKTKCQVLDRWSLNFAKHSCVSNIAVQTGWVCAGCLCEHAGPPSELLKEPTRCYKVDAELEAQHARCGSFICWFTPPVWLVIILSSSGFRGLAYPSTAIFLT